MTDQVRVNAAAVAAAVAQFIAVGQAVIVTV
jgi:hypothetical protein